MPKMDKQYIRIAQVILEGKFDEDEFDEDDLWKTSETMAIYFQFLKENISHPCIITGVEDFPWEERFLFGVGNEKEHEELKKNNPSSEDTFELIKIEEDEYEEVIQAIVKRQSDKKEFVIALDWLEAVNRNTKNYQTLHDYAVWFVNY